MRRKACPNRPQTDPKPPPGGGHPTRWDLKSGINGVPPVYVVPCGMSLTDTLCANWTTCHDLGEPAWVNPETHPTPGQRVPLLTGLTLLSRRVWLHQPSAQGVCVACGASEQGLIRTCEFQTAGRQESDLWDDPHVVYLGTEPRKAARATDLTAAGKFTMDRPWPDLLAGLLESRKFGSSQRPMSLLLVGFGTRQAKSVDVWERMVEVPPDESDREAAGLTVLRWQRQVSGLTRRCRPKVRSPGRKYVEIAATVSAIRPHVEGKVSSKVGELLGGGDAAWAQAAREFSPMMDAIAQSLAPGFTASAVERRKDVASVIPSMGQRTKPAKKLRRKKGGDK